MKTWSISLTPDSQKDYKKLDGSQKAKVDAAIEKLLENPLPRAKGGYGQELGNKYGYNLAGYLKIKLRGSGIRIIYDVKEEHGKAYVIIIGMRKDEKVYKLAARRIEKYEAWFDSLSSLMGEDSDQDSK